MEDDFAVDVLICGAGAAGLTLAIDLARRGVSFRLIEKMDDPFRGSRGKGVKPRTQELFEDLGILDRIVAAGGVYPPEREYRADGGHVDSEITDHEEPTAAEPYHIQLMSPQFLTEGAMRERLAELGHSPEYGCELVGFEQTGAGLDAQLSSRQGPQCVRVRYLIGADGGRSFVRHALNIGFPGRTLGSRAMVADVVVTGLARDAWHHFNEGGDLQVSLCPLMGTDIFQLQAPIPLQGPLEGDVDLSVEGLNRFVAARTSRHDIRIQSVSWASAFDMNARLADRYRVGRAFLIGDAAHIHPPTGGQGLNTSVQDAYNLGWKLAAVIAGAPDALLDTYEEERRPIAAEMLGLATKLLEAAKRGDMRRSRDVKQLDLGYPGSSLAAEAPERQAGPLAGDRAPDAILRGAAGQARRLFDLFRGPHWTLLGYQVGHDKPKPRPNLHIHLIGPQSELDDDRGQFKDAYSPTPGDWFLIRPDGYIGAVVGAEKLGVIDRYLATVGIGPLTAGPSTEGDANARH